MTQEKKKMFVKKEIYKAIAYFIRRQHLVAQAMRDLGLDLKEVGKWGAAAWASLGTTEAPDTLDDSNPDDIRKLFELRNQPKSKKLSQTGIWEFEGEWEYFLHGGGCRLHNIQTGEVIDWNCPNVLAFDPYFFLDHLRWRLNYSYEDELQYTRNWIQEHSGDFNSVIILIEEMIKEGLINRDFTLPDFDNTL